MPQDPSKYLPKRKQTRLREYDYSNPVAYFITICSQGRKCIFGEIAGEKMNLNHLGQLIQEWWLELSRKFPEIKTDECVIMPNHFHGIIIIVGADLCVGPIMTGARAGAPLQKIVQWFKTMTTNSIFREMKKEKKQIKLWQRCYYEHVIRNENELNAIREYIINNPLKWALDADNPANLI